MANKSNIILPISKKDKEEIPNCLPEGFVELPDPFKLESDILLIIGDTQIPFHDKVAMMTALGYRDDFDTLLINGDWLDFHKASHYKKRVTNPEIADELKDGYQSLLYLRNRFPKKRIIYQIGNHEARLDDYIQSHAPQLAGCEFTHLRSILKLDELGIEMVEQGRGIRLSSLNVIHGDQIKGGGVNPSRTLLLKTLDNTLQNDKHKKDETTGVTINKKFIGAWTVGCLCNLRPAYLPNNQWTHGFAIVETDGDYFEVHNKMIINGRVV